MTPGLSVIVDAIKESRRIVQRMNSYAIYRIAETLRVLLFVTMVILLFNFFPVTAIMIVLLALMNDGAILTIAYDNVRYRRQPEAWNMRLVIGIASVLGVVGPIAAMGLFVLGDSALHLGRPRLQTLMYLMLSVAGHLTVFLARTRGPFWSIRPKRILVTAVLATQVLATLIAVYGVFMTPIGWGLAALVWGYALVWFLISDRIKLVAYRVFDRPATGASIPSRATGQGSPAADQQVQYSVSATDRGGPDGTSAVAAFHATNQEEIPVYHDRSDCPYGQEIIRDGHVEPGTGGRRLCDWCAQALSPAA
jgi:H+-transporting ATPase